MASLTILQANAMNYLRHILSLVFLSLFTLGIQAQDYLETFKSGSLSRLEYHLADNVDIELKRNKRSLSKTDAIAAIRKRLKEFGAVEWELMHKGASEGNSSNYIILKATKENGDALRISLRTKQIDGVKKVTSIRFRRAL